MAQISVFRATGRIPPVGVGRHPGKRDGDFNSHLELGKDRAPVRLRALWIGANISILASLFKAGNYLCFPHCAGLHRNVSLKSIAKSQ